MLRPLGHDETLKATENDLPSAILLIGPPSTGKMTVIRYVARRHSILPTDTFDPRKLSVDEARKIRHFLQTRPMAPTGKKAVILNLDGASPEALNALLKVLEEPPEYARFMLASTNQPPLTIVSRCTTFRNGFLLEETIRQLLVTKFKMAEAAADKAAAASGGQVRVALASSELSSAKGPVLSILKALADGDADLLSNALAKFGTDELRLALTWCTEARTGLWRVFSTEESFGLHLNRAAVDKISRALAQGSRPRVAVRLAAVTAAAELERGRRTA